MLDIPKKYGLYDPRYEHDSCGVGFMAQIRGERSHQIVRDADEMLCRMDHRGACGAEPNTGDGAGILTALPHEFFSSVASFEFGVADLTPGRFGVGNFFLPMNRTSRETCLDIIRDAVQEQQQHWIGWRSIPIDFDGANLGVTSRLAAPYFAQIFIKAADDVDFDEFERQLYLIRKTASHRVRQSHIERATQSYYCCSLSTRVIVFKGMLTSWQLRRFYSDLRQDDYRTHLCMVHSRFSTNTFPSWSRAQPLRWMSHNGEINTLRGNINWMRAREGAIRSHRFGDQISKVLPVIDAEASDSGSFDNVLELLIMAGRSLPESVMIMIPEAWQKHPSMPEDQRAFYEFQSCVMEPWDGPASIVFTDGKLIGAVLDRNGLRPSRFYITHDDRVIMASEVGVNAVAPELIKEKGRLRAGWMFLVDFEQGRVVPDDEIKHEFATRRPYGEWLRKSRLVLGDLPEGANPHGYYPETLLPRMHAFGHTVETGHFLLFPLIREERDPLGSMGNDAALACLSDQPRLIYDYFRQLFAQVTNPPIDSIREEIVMSLECYVGPEGNLLEPQMHDCARLLVPHPILTNEELAAIRHLNYRGWSSANIDITFARQAGPEGLKPALDRVCEEADRAVAVGKSLIVLSDRAVNHDRVPISALLAVGAVHHHLVRNASRSRVGVIVETGEAREVHHHCLLVGYGVDAINPYLAFESLWKAQRDGLLTTEEFPNDDSIVRAYRQGVAKGLLKVMAKMGISTLQSYKGAQIFEAIGLRDEVMDRCFVGTSSRIQGVGFNELALEALRRHERGFPVNASEELPLLPNPGEFHWRANGELHAWDPIAIAELQLAARQGSRDAYRRFSRHMQAGARRRCTLRGLLDFKSDTGMNPVPLDQVEPATRMVRRFCTGAMSFGSISAEAHESLAIAMNRIGGKSNTGEGGEDPARYQRLPNGDSKRSAIKQVASGRFGVTINYLTNADELQIKIAQGAKPGEGGELPGRKVDQTIARIRYSTPGVGLISPPPHHDIYSIEDLKQLIFDLKNANPFARISVKLVSEVGVGTIAAGVAKGFADHIVIAGDSGGTGASPLTSIKHAGLPWELGLAETQQTLVQNDLRSRVVLQTDGGLRTGRDVVIAAMLGAEEFGFATAPLITLGCIMMRKCHLNTCPVGIATQDPELRKKFSGQPEHVINYMFLVAEEAREIMASLGVSRFEQLIGRCDLLETSRAINHWKADGLDLSALFTLARKPQPHTEVFRTRRQDHQLHWALDNKLIEAAAVALESKTPVNENFPIYNRNRTVGTMLSHEVARRYGEEGLPDGTIHFKFRGSAGQSFGAFLAGGVTLELEGDANDYVGKGLSGGRIIIYPPSASGFRAEENIIVGNVVLYGAVCGEMFLRGQAAERFCVRNSGAMVVVEGVGDHGCEYMTGGRAIILGPTGNNFAAGMSGGIAYIWDANRDFPARCNLNTVELESITSPDEAAEVVTLITRHYQYTQSEVAARLLARGKLVLAEFVKVMPRDLKRVMEAAGSTVHLVTSR
jgi:glutamate synthase (NADPH/NADH) large chain